MYNQKYKSNDYKFDKMQKEHSYKHKCKQVKQKLKEMDRFKKKLRNVHNAQEQITRKKHENLKNLQKYFKWLSPDLKNYIWEFVDSNTRLNYIQSQYTEQFMMHKLDSLPNTPAINQKLFMCMKYIIHIYNECVEYEFKCLYELAIWYLNQTLFKSFNDNFRRFYMSVIKLSLKKYTKMYEKTNNISEIYANEKRMIKLYLYILSF